MNLAEVVSRLRSAGVPDRFYVTDRGPGAGEWVGIEPIPNGWSVCYSERGSKSPLETCPDEDAACRALLRQVDRMMRDNGRGGVLGAT